MIGLAYEDLDSDIGFSSHRLPRAGQKKSEGKGGLKGRSRPSFGYLKGERAYDGDLRG